MAHQDPMTPAFERVYVRIALIFAASLAPASTVALAQDFQSKVEENVNRPGSD